MGERIFQRPEHQRQRRAELVADVGEELGLEPVQLLEPLVEDPQLLGLAGHLLFGRLRSVMFRPSGSKYSTSPDSPRMGCREKSIVMGASPDCSP